MSELIEREGEEEEEGGGLRTIQWGSGFHLEIVPRG